MNIDKIFVTKDFPECCMKCDFINFPTDEINYYWCLFTREKEPIDHGLMLRYRRMSKCPLINKECIYEDEWKRNFIDAINETKKHFFGG